tara:strand:- start:3399 stop:4457 length:1059 start_codon:yes stop_codon:yes gene_type:complete
MAASDHTNNGIPVGVGYDSRDRAKSLMELSSISVTTISATNYLGIDHPAVGGVTELSGLTDVCDIQATTGQSLVWASGEWCPSTVVATASADPQVGINTTNIGSNSGTIISNTASIGINATNIGSNSGTIISNTNNITTNANAAYLTASGPNTGLTNEQVVTSTPTLTFGYANGNFSGTVEETALNHDNLIGVETSVSHLEYTLSATNANLSSLVSSIETSTIDISGYITTNEGDWINTNHAIFIEKSITIESPVVGDNITLMNAVQNYNLTGIHTVMSAVGEPASAAWTINTAANRTTPTLLFASGTGSTSGESMATGDKSIAASDYVWIVIDSLSGTFTDLHISLHLEVP